MVLADDPGGELVREVPARVGHPGVSTGHLDDGLGAVVRPLRLPAEVLLRLLQAAFGAAQELGVVDLPAVRQHREMRQPQIDPDLARRLRQRLGAGLDHERGEVPPGRVLDHGHARRLGRQAAGPFHRHVADLRQAQLPARRDGEAGVSGEADRLPVVPFGPEPGRGHLRPLAFPGHRGEESPVGGVQVRQRLL